MVVEYPGRRRWWCWWRAAKPVRESYYRVKAKVLTGRYTSAEPGVWWTVSGELIAADYARQRLDMQLDFYEQLERRDVKLLNEAEEHASKAARALRRVV